MKKTLFLFLPIIILFTSSCKDAASSKEAVVAKADTPVPVASAVTNPRFSIAPDEYADIAEKALMHVGNREFDAWGDMLADNVEYYFPDGDIGTRTKLTGKAAVVGWWKSLKEKSGIDSMKMSEFNHFPLNVTAQPKGGAAMGVYDFCYFSNTLMIKGKPLALRMNYVTHFNADKKIDRYVTYYDRTALVKAIGKNVLDEAKQKQ